MDTIFALASAPGRAGVAVIRVSGPDAFAVGDVFGVELPRDRGLRALRDDMGDVLDEALVLVFAQGRSFTGEAVVELHVHGSPAVTAAVLRRLAGRAGFRLAEAGEFTRRAMLSGRLDLAQVEGLADLIDAETEAQRRQAMRVFQGDLGVLAESWRSRLIRAASLIEATIDFVDEDVPVDVMPEVRGLLGGVLDDLGVEIAGVAAAERLRAGFEVAIVGPPNAGKSTLLNRLARREAAITSEIAGTTRDVIEVRMDIGGLPVTLLDTAGLRETTDTIERIGVDRARARAADAELRVFLVPEGAEVPDLYRDGDLVLRAKDDDGSAGGVSGLTGAGVPQLLGSIQSGLAGRLMVAGTATRERHGAAMTRAAACLRDALSTIDRSGPADLVAAELRFAVRAIESIVGRVDVEDLLDEIFSRFCIGK